MLDIVAADQHELALAVEIVDVDHAEPRLPGAAATLPLDAQPAILDLPREQAQQHQQDQNDAEGDDPLLRGREIEAKQALQGLPHKRRRGRVPAAGIHPMLNTLAIA